MKTQILFVFFSMLFLSLPGNAERVESVPYNPIVGKSASTTDTSAFLGIGNQAFTINMTDVPIDMTTIAGEITGVVFPLSSPVTASQLSWKPINGGYVTRIHVSSNQAKRLRFHLVIDNNIPSINFRVKGNLDNSPVGPVDNTDIHDGAIWLPITNGNSADLEIFVDDTSTPNTLNFKIDAINLIVAKFSNGNTSGIVNESLGLAQQQEFDLACWTGTAYSQGLQEAASATAKIDYISSKDGLSYTCTGTLLADKGDTIIPWFATANHCISDQATANSASFEWFFQATTCNARTTDSRYKQTFGGAQLFWTDVTLEASFLRLYRPPAIGAILSGWDTSIQVGDLVWGVHHPKSDHTMVSQGHVAALLGTIYTEAGPHVLDTVNYSYGGTESGSSGSGIFSVENGHAYWKGTLFGGPANNYQISTYSHFASYYDNLKPLLANPKLMQIGCLLNWAEAYYPQIFSPARAVMLFSSPYIYRYYGNTNTYLGISFADNHVYYLNSNGILWDEGYFPGWLAKAGCQ